MTRSYAHHLPFIDRLNMPAPSCGITKMSKGAVDSILKDACEDLPGSNVDGISVYVPANAKALSAMFVSGGAPSIAHR